MREGWATCLVDRLFLCTCPHRRAFYKHGCVGTRPQHSRPLMTLPTSTQRLRACCVSDLPAIGDILEYYVNNTVMTLALSSPSLDDVYYEGWKKIASQGLPYIAAVEEGGETVLGYCYAGEFRGGGGRGGYRHTVELSLFCHPDHTEKGVGLQLLQKL